MCQNHGIMACWDAQARATLCAMFFCACRSVQCNLVFDSRCVQTRVERATERAASGFSTMRVRIGCSPILRESIMLCRKQAHPK